MEFGEHLQASCVVLFESEPLTRESSRFYFKLGIYDPAKQLLKQ